MKEVAFTISTQSPFRLDLTAWALRRRPDNLIDRWDGRVYRRVLLLGPQQEPVEAAVRASRDGSGDNSVLTVTLSGSEVGPASVPAAEAAVRRLFGLNVDVSEFYALAEGDVLLSPLARRFRGLRPPRFPSIFETVANAIACQQVSLTLGILLLNRLAQSYGRAYRNATTDSGSTETIARAFPTPEDLAGTGPEALRSLGFSHQKARYLIDLATTVASGELDLEALAELDSSEALTELRRLRGVGRWSAEYVLLRGLGRLAVFPGDDVGARNNLQKWLRLAGALDYDEVQRVVARWQPYSGLVYLHLLLDSLARRGVIGSD